MTGSLTPFPRRDEDVRAGPTNSNAVGTGLTSPLQADPRVFTATSAARSSTVGTDPFAADLDDTERDALINAVDHWVQFAPRLFPSIDGVLERPQWRARRYGR